MNRQQKQQFLQIPEVAALAKELQRKRFQLVLKRLFDLVAASILFILLIPACLVISLVIVLDSKGPVLFKQERVTRYGRRFKIYKFRTMTVDAPKVGTAVTQFNDPRITRSGRFLRKFCLDEFPQLLNIIKGDMSFVGPRPEVPKYVDHYTPEMLATLLLPSGITSPASIAYKNESELLKAATDVDEVYINKILPEKMAYNIEYIRNFSFLGDIKIMFQTVWAVLRQ